MKKLALSVILFLSLFSVTGATMFSTKSATVFVYTDKTRTEAEYSSGKNNYYINIILDLDRKTVSMSSPEDRNKQVVFKILNVEFNNYLMMKIVCDKNCYFQIGKEMIDFGYNNENKFTTFLIRNVQNF